MQVLATNADVAEGSFAGPDAMGEYPQPGKGDGEGQPAEQGGPLPGAEFLVECTVDVAWGWRESCHTAPLPSQPPGAIHSGPSGSAAGPHRARL